MKACDSYNGMNTAGNHSEWKAGKGERNRDIGLQDRSCTGIAF
ncbi:MAG: hypothetical protein ACXWC7_11865 [Chitinophagaceae bacterium]